LSAHAARLQPIACRLLGLFQSGWPHDVHSILTNVGIAAAATLPRELTCSRCASSSRYVKAEDCRRVASRTAVIEWLCGAEAPRAR
jgi:hypothetical protein